MESLREKIKSGNSKLKDELSITNDLAMPRLKKVILNVGIGSISDKKKRELIYDRIAKISGQKPIWVKSKKSIANFKVRRGDSIGIKVTLRGEMMYQFIDKLINISIPRMRDFQGIPIDSVDEMGNVTIGVDEHTIFPETQDEDLKDVFGLSITIITSAKNSKNAIKFFKSIGLPIKNVENALN